MLIEGSDIGGASGAIVNDADMCTGFGVNQLHFSLAGRGTIFLAPELNEQKLVAEIGDVLQGPKAIDIVEKVGDDDSQAALWVFVEVAASSLEVIRFASSA